MQLKDSVWNSTVVDEEIKALESNGTWTLIKLHPGKSLVGCKQIFTVKYKADGGVERFKQRLVAKSFTDQSHGAKLNTVCILLSLTVSQDRPLHQLDVKQALFNGDLEEEVYIAGSS